MGVHVPLPTSQDAVDDPPQAVDLQRESLVDCPEVVRSSLVPSALVMVPHTAAAPRGPTLSGVERVPLGITGSSRMDFLAHWLRSSGESPHVIDEIGRGLRASTVRQYEAAWRSLGSFLAASTPRVMSSQLMRDYFSFLFRDKKLALSTIAAYKSALADPLSLAFGLDLQTRLIELQKRSFFTDRPPTCLVGTPCGGVHPGPGFSVVPNQQTEKDAVPCGHGNGHADN